jgi:hypothetical protein
MIAVAESPNSTLRFLAKHLPAAVDQASPNGTIQPGT